MNTKIIVSSNCQTGEISAALKFLLPNSIIQPLPLPAIDDEKAK
jgi:hypothetical protein